MKASGRGVYSSAIMSPIRQLPRSVVDRIAAGEVIERPACVVKELVENALDAGARRIAVEVDGAGTERIRVVDDGSGIPPEELELAVASHATSKLTDTDDLVHIRSMGFRGEALASIASISHLTLTSRTPDAGQAAVVSNRSGAFGEVRPAGAPVGTSVEVGDLFYNVPARKKFLKSTRTEMGHVDRALQRTALPRSGVAFGLVSGGRQTVEIAAGASLGQRIKAFFGPGVADDLIPVSTVGDDVTVHGLVGPPEMARSNAAMVHFFVNGRFVTDRALLGALADAYREYLPVRRYPVVFLFLEMAPEDVDVNVHPRKLEVRFRRPDRLYPLVRSAVGLALGGVRALAKSPPLGSNLLRERSPWSPVPDGRTERAPDVSPAASPAPAPVRSPEPAAISIGRCFQVHDTYLIEETAGGIRVYDQHAFHERVLFFKFKARLDSAPLESQILLLPVTLEVDAGEMEVVGESAEVLRRAGLEVEPFGPTSIVLRSVPAVLRGRDPEPFLREVIDSIRRGRFRGRVVEPVEAMLATLSCRAAVKAGDRLSEREMADLLRLAATVPHAETCPHGRPTTMEISLAELEKSFHRR